VLADARAAAVKVREAVGLPPAPSPTPSRN
jgi:hypothetical protein